MVEFDGDDPRAFVESKNLHRRSLTPSQRAMAVVQMNAWAQSGSNQHTDSGGELSSPPPATVSEMAESAKVSKRTIQDAKRAEENGHAKAVVGGEMSAREAAGRPNKPKSEKPDPLAELRAEVAELREQNRDLSDTLKIHLLADEDKSEQLRALEQSQALVRSLESQLQEKQAELLSWQREAKALRKKVSAHD